MAGIIQGCIERIRRMLTGGTGGTGEAQSRGVTVNVGLTDEQIAQYAEYLERGWSQVVDAARQAGYLNSRGLRVRPGTVLVCPPRPSFGMAAEKNREKWRRVAQNLARSQMPNLDVRGIAAMLGQIARDDVKTQIATADGMPPRSPATLVLYAHEMAASGHSASGTAGMTQTKPLVKTGAFLGHVDFEIKDGL